MARMLLLITLTVSLAVGYIGDEWEWTDASWSRPTHFVNPHHLEATDEDNPCGTPYRPRVTIPPLAPGDQLYLTFALPHYTGEIIARGTFEDPIIIRGGGQPILDGVHIHGGYVIFEWCEPRNLTADGPVRFVHCIYSGFLNPLGDLDADGDVDLDDFTILKQNFGRTCPRE
ncbi:MAG TPA: hypothetical protein VM487_22055 [Phycisphaerae bacterium]|nr:hypothetical protein [Phycisphaerae bacterium]